MLRGVIGGALRAIVGKDLYTRLRIGSLPEHSYLGKVPGIIHIGANTGQERELYAAFGLHVAWIEPIPEVFDRLKCNISAFPKQRAYKYLVIDRDGEEYTFNVADNDGASSSILDFSRHKEMWPQISYIDTIRLRSTRLDSFVKKEAIDLKQFGALVLDTQGSELTVLIGAGSLISSFTFIKLEVADFESYKGCCQLPAVSEFMLGKGFREHTRVAFKHIAEVGTYFDVIYRRANRELR